MKYPFYLASQSPRRKQILEWAGIPFTAVSTNLDEKFDESLDKRNVAQFLAEQKAFAAAELIKSKPVTIIAADTIVLAKEKILGKPENKEIAINMLQFLSGKRHEVITGVCVHTPEFHFSFSATTLVYFNEISEHDILFYIENYKPFDKAGSYAIQEWIGMRAVQKIDGCFFNVMGLPIALLIEKLKIKNLL